MQLGSSVILNATCTSLRQGVGHPRFRAVACYVCSALPCGATVAAPDSNP